MKKKIRFDLSGVTAMIHLTVVLSAASIITIICSLGILELPALTSVFIIGKDVILRRFDVHDSVSKRFFRQLKEQLCMMRYLPLQLIAVLQGASVIACVKLGYDVLGFLLTAIMAFMLTLLVYIVTYHVFCTAQPSVTEVLIAMFYKIGQLIAVWAMQLIIILFFSVRLLPFAVIIGAVPLILAEAVSFIGIMSFRKASGMITENEMNDIGENLIKSF